MQDPTSEIEKYLAASWNLEKYGDLVQIIKP